MIHKDEYRIEAAYRKYIYRADVAQRYQTHDILVSSLCWVFCYIRSACYTRCVTSIRVFGVI